GDVACVIMETIPATYGFPLPEEGYLARVKEMGERYGTLYIADEVQTELSRTGKLWGFEHYGKEPDILVMAKGLSGGIYPIGGNCCTCGCRKLDERRWICSYLYFWWIRTRVYLAMKVLEISKRQEVFENVGYVRVIYVQGLKR